MDSSNMDNKENMAWIEINKIIAEKQMKFVQGKTAIKTYKREIESLKDEAKLLDVQKQCKNIEFEALQKEQASKTRELELINKLNANMAWKLQNIKEEVKEMEQKLLTEKQEWTKYQEKKAEDFNKIKQTFFEADPLYIEVKALEAENKELVHKNKVLEDTNFELERAEKAEEEAAKKARNKILIDFAQDMCKLDKYETMKSKFEEAQLQFDALNAKLMSHLLSADESCVEVDPVSNLSEDNSLSQKVASNIKVTDLSQDPQNNGCNEDDFTNTKDVSEVKKFVSFKVPETPALPKRCAQSLSSSTQSKIDILDNIIVTTTANKFDNKRKSSKSTEQKTTKIVKFDNAFGNTSPTFSIDSSTEHNNEIFSAAQPIRPEGSGSYLRDFMSEFNIFNNFGGDDGEDGDDNGVGSLGIDSGFQWD